MMERSEFEYLPEKEKIDLLYKAGAYIGKCYKGLHPVLLYQLESFYVEIYYWSYRLHISQMHCFDSTDLLQPYLDSIEIEHLVSGI